MMGKNGDLNLEVRETLSSKVIHSQMYAVSEVETTRFFALEGRLVQCVAEECREEDEI